MLFLMNSNCEILPRIQENIARFHFMWQHIARNSWKFPVARYKTAWLAVIVSQYHGSSWAVMGNPLDTLNCVITWGGEGGVGVRLRARKSSWICIALTVVACDAGKRFGFITAADTLPSTSNTVSPRYFMSKLTIKVRSLCFSSP